MKNTYNGGGCISAWFPLIINKGNNIEKTAPLMKYDSGIEVRTERGKPNPTK